MDKFMYFYFFVMWIISAIAFIGCVVARFTNTKEVSAYTNLNLKTWIAIAFTCIAYLGMKVLGE